jgi:hypothetical protein
MMRDDVGRVELLSTRRWRKSFPDVLRVEVYCICGYKLLAAAAAAAAACCCLLLLAAACCCLLLLLLLLLLLHLLLVAAAFLCRQAQRLIYVLFAR